MLSTKNTLTELDSSNKGSHMIPVKYILNTDSFEKRSEIIRVLCAFNGSQSVCAARTAKWRRTVKTSTESSARPSTMKDYTRSYTAATDATRAYSTWTKPKQWFQYLPRVSMTFEIENLTSESCYFVFSLFRCARISLWPIGLLGKPRSPTNSTFLGLSASEWSIGGVRNAVSV